MSQLLRDADRIHLDGAQADSLATMNVVLTTALDSIWAEFSGYAAAVTADYDQGNAYAHYRRARRASVDVLIALAPRGGCSRGIRRQ